MRQNWWYISQSKNLHLQIVAAPNFLRLGNLKRRAYFDILSLVAEYGIDHIESSNKIRA